MGDGSTQLGERLPEGTLVRWAAAPTLLEDLMRMEGQVLLQIVAGQLDGLGGTD